MTSAMLVAGLGTLAVLGAALTENHMCNGRTAEDAATNLRSNILRVLITLKVADGITSDLPAAAH